MNCACGASKQTVAVRHCQARPVLYTHPCKQAACQHLVSLSEHIMRLPVTAIKRVLVGQIRDTQVIIRFGKLLCEQHDRLNVALEHCHMMRCCDWLF